MTKIIKATSTKTDEDKYFEFYSIKECKKANPTFKDFEVVGLL